VAPRQVVIFFAAATVRPKLMLTQTDLASVVRLLSSALTALEALGKELTRQLDAAAAAASPSFTRALTAEALALLLDSRALDPASRVAALFLLYALYFRTRPDASAASGKAGAEPLPVPGLVPDHPFLPTLFSLIDKDATPPDAVSIETFFMARFCENPQEVRFALSAPDPLLSQAVPFFLFPPIARLSFPSPCTRSPPCPIIPFDYNTKYFYSR